MKHKTEPAQKTSKMSIQITAAKTTLMLKSRHQTAAGSADRLQQKTDTEMFPNHKKNQFRVLTLITCIY
jgi:hypothetical protein